MCLEWLSHFKGPHQSETGVADIMWINLITVGLKQGYGVGGAGWNHPMNRRASLIIVAQPG